MASVDTRTRQTSALPKRERTRIALLKAATDLLGQPDGRLVRIEDVVSQVGMTRSTFYNHFDSRESLFDAVAFELSHSFNSALLPIVAESGDPARYVVMAILYYLRRAQREHRWAWAMVNVSMSTPKLFGEETFDECTKSIVAGWEAGVFKLRRPEVGRDLLLGTILTAFLNIVNSTPDEGYVAEVTVCVMRGLGVPLSKAERLVAAPLPPLPPY